MALLGLLGASLTACHFGPTGWLDDYLERLERVTGTVTGPVVVDPSGLSYPPGRIRTTTPEAARMGFVRSFGLRRCGLQDLVAERNAALGRVMTATRRLGYEVEFLRRAQDCLPRLREEGDAPELVAELGEAVAGKRRDLPALLWNATAGSEEMAALFALEPGVWPRDRDTLAQRRDGAAAASQGLVELAALAASVRRDVEDPQGEPSGAAREPAAALEGVLKERSDGALGGLLWTAETLVRYLREASDTVRSHACVEGAEGVAARSQAEVLGRVFEIFYVGEAEDPLDRAGLQEYASLVEQSLRAFTASWTLLRHALDGGAPEDFGDSAFVALVESDGGLHERLRRAVDEHARAWQGLFVRCGVDAAPLLDGVPPTEPTPQPEEIP